MNRLRNEWPRVQMLMGVGLSWWWSQLSWLVVPLTRRFEQHAASTFLVASVDGHLSVPVNEDRVDYAPIEQDLPLPVNWEAQCSGRQVFVSVDPDLVMRIPITLPRSALSDIKSAVRYKLISESPLPLEELFFDTHILPPNRERGEKNDVLIDVAICRRSTVESLSKTLEAAGVSTSIIGFARDSKSPLDFVFLTSRGAKEARASLRVNRMLALSIFLIGLSVFPITYVSARWLTAQVHSEISTARDRLDGRMPLYEQRAFIRAAQSELTRHTTAPRLSSVLNDLASYLPHNSWLHMIRYENNTLRITGFSPVPTEVAQSLEGIHILSRVKLDSVTGTDERQESTRVQFELSALIQQRVSP